MPTRQETARLNGARSRGPITPAGKARSSRNALRHGLAATQLVLPDESLGAFRRLVRRYNAHFQPTSHIENELVHTMALARWRLQRLATIEPCLFTNELHISRRNVSRELSHPTPEQRLAYVFRNTSGHNGIELLSHYETKLTGLYERALERLHTLRVQETNEPRKSSARPKATRP